jgi:carbonic anhydrase/acetyltransferase-like protein (isoleucine patch superfamily)
MIDRQLVGDVVLAALVAIPAAALARPDLPQIHTVTNSTPVQKSVVALAPTEERQVGIYR